MKRFKTIFEYADNMWIASCGELKLTLEENSFDALVIRMKAAIQDIAEIELGYNTVEILITVAEIAVMDGGKCL